jgi:hypothetical protein
MILISRPTSMGLTGRGDALADALLFAGAALGQDGGTDPGNQSRHIAQQARAGVLQ